MFRQHEAVGKPSGSFVAMTKEDTRKKYTIYIHASLDDQFVG
jgi:hypothetical protein